MNQLMQIQEQPNYFRNENQNAVSFSEEQNTSIINQSTYQNQNNNNIYPNQNPYNGMGIKDYQKNSMPFHLVNDDQFEPRVIFFLL